ncbi:outer membrane lipoprotein-sorting protein [Paraburkholderia sp. GAS448]|uniref:outer membrane lipoprotein-sorting protein n=1 Tax=Paraburkholderia sp. GAS448 TaxID=3035136 RepID=UPI003D20C41A
MNRYDLILLRTRLVLAAALSVAVGAALAAQTASMSANQVVAKNVAARGGLPAWRQVHAMTFVGKIDAGRTHPDPEGTVDNPSSSPGRRHMLEKALSRKPDATQGTVISLPYRMELKRPRKVRLEVDFAGKTAVQVYDGTNGWYARPYLGSSAVQPFSPAELKLAGDQQELDGLLIDAAAKGNQVSMDGVEALDGHRAYKLKVTLRNGDIRHVWVDASTFLDVKVDGTRQVGGRTRTMVTTLRDYRKVDGVMIPFMMETVGEGVRLPERIVIEKATVNPDLPDDRFARPQSPKAG